MSSTSTIYSEDFKNMVVEVYTTEKPIKEICVDLYLKLVLCQICWFIQNSNVILVNIK